MARKINELIDSIGREKLFQIIALLPIFFSWLIVYSRKEVTEDQKKFCFYGGLFSFYFFLLLFFSFIFSLIPLIGNYVGNIVHLAAVLIYVGLSGKFIYALYLGKKIEINFVEKNIRKLNEILQ